MPPTILGHIGSFLGDRERWSFARSAAPIYRELCANPQIARQAQDGEYPRDPHQALPVAPDKRSRLLLAARRLAGVETQQARVPGCPSPAARLLSISWLQDSSWAAFWDDYSRFAATQLDFGFAAQTCFSDVGPQVVLSDAKRGLVMQWQLASGKSQVWDGETANDFEPSTAAPIARGGGAIVRLESTANRSQIRLLIHAQPDDRLGGTCYEMPSRIEYPAIDFDGEMLVARPLSLQPPQLQTFVRRQKKYEAVGSPFAGGEPLSLTRCPFTQRRVLWTEDKEVELPGAFITTQKLFVWDAADSQWQPVFLSNDAKHGLHEVSFDPTGPDLVLTYLARPSAKLLHSIKLPFQASPPRGSAVGVKRQPLSCTTIQSESSYPPRAVMSHDIPNPTLSFVAPGYRRDIAASERETAVRRLLYVSPAATVAAIVEQLPPGLHLSSPRPFRVQLFADKGGQILRVPPFELPEVRTFCCANSHDPIRFSAYLAGGRVIVGTARTDIPSKMSLELYEAVPTDAERPAGMMFTRHSEQLLLFGGVETGPSMTTYRLTSIDMTRLQRRFYLFYDYSQSLRLLPAAESVDGRRVLIGDPSGSLFSLLPAHLRAPNMTCPAPLQRWSPIKLRQPLAERPRITNRAVAL